MNKLGGTRWEIDTMVYGIPSHRFVTKQQVVFIVFINFRIYILTISLSVVMGDTGKFKTIRCQYDIEDFSTIQYFLIRYLNWYLKVFQKYFLVFH